VRRHGSGNQARDPAARFIDEEAAGGLLLAAAAVLALIASNAPGLSALYEGMLSTRLSVEIGSLRLGKPLLLWINEGLMAVFFLRVGLELKREALEGHLSTREQAMLPAFAAAGGMAAPAGIYYLAAGADPMLARGWAIPAATDIAFALGALSLLGKRVPAALKIFLLTLATLDDFGAIVIIAMFYTEDLSAQASLLAAGALIVLFTLNRMGIERLGLYLLTGIALWIFVVESGIHATLAGVALAMAIPLRARDGRPIVAPLEETLNPYVRYLIMPIFAFANAGLPLMGLSPASLLAPLPLAIMLGLVLGKPLGIVAAAALAAASGLARLPADASWRAMIGIGCIAGIGFTMSLFIGSLAFESVDHTAQVRLGVICGSVISAVLGFAILHQSTKDGRPTSTPD